MPGSHWANYEEVAQFILNAMAKHFGVGRVEGKQVVPGASGTESEIDAKGQRQPAACYPCVTRRTTLLGGLSEMTAFLEENWSRRPDLNW
jgi:hypothetical protein